MSQGYWIKGYPYTSADKNAYSNNPVIHRFDTKEEAEFFKSQIAHGEMLPWGDAENDDGR